MESIKDEEINDGNTYYYDEDGLGLKIHEHAPNYFKLSDDKGNISYFSNGHLVYIDDNNGNRIRIDYIHSDGTSESTGYPNTTGDRINKIVQKNKGGTEITIATFQYTTYEGIANYLQSVTDYAGNVYSFGYSCYKLLKIYRNGDLYVRFQLPYNNSTSRFDNPVIGVVDAEACYGVHLTYDSLGRVNKYYESYGSFDSNDAYTVTSSGAGATITYSTGNQTTYRDWGNDRAVNTDDDILTTYSFDYAGRTACASTADVYGRVLGASNAVYTSTGSTDKTNNRTLRSASIGVAAMGLLRNGNFESSVSGDAWTMVGTSASGVNAVVNTDGHRTGKYALKTWVQKDTKGIVGAQRQVSLHTDNNYTLSAYVNTSAATSFGGDGIYLQVKDTSGNVWTSNYVNYATSTDVDSGWTRISVPFYTHVTGTHTLTVYCSGVGGISYIDDVQLEKASAPSNVNLLENGNFQTWDYGWEKTNASFVTNQSSDATGSSAYAMRVNGNPANDSYASQTVQINEAGKSYVLSGWAKANAVPDNVTKGNTKTDSEAKAKDTDKQFGLRAILTYADGTKEYHYVPFNPQLTNWQFTSMAVVPKKSATVSTIQVVCAYEKNANTAYFDNISLVKEVAQTMKYDKDGNLTSVKSTGNDEETGSYSNGNLIKQVTGGYGTLTYTYYDNHNLKTASNNTVKETVTYDTSGNATGFTMESKKAGYRKFGTSSTYTTDRNRVASSTDMAGFSTRYTYDNPINVMANLPSTITNPKNTVRTFTYNSETGRALQQYISGIIATGNTYDAKGNLTTITRAGYYDNNGTSTRVTQTYNFAYDGFGNTTSIKVGSKTLTSYTYAAKDGLLTKQTYGNGAFTSFTYDKLGRKIQTTTSSGDTYTYKYTGDGQLHSMTDTKGGFAYQYTYDTLGRLMQATRTSTSDANHAKTMQASYTYDTDNRITKVAYNIPDLDNTFASYYYSSDSTSTDVAVGALTKMSMFSKGWINYTYDAQGRLFTRNIGGLLNESYAYLSKPSDTTNYTTTWVSAKGIADQNGTSLKYFAYNYNSLGYITTEQETRSGTKLQYSYDKQGQLLTAKKYVNNVLQKTYTYTYDTYGNLRTATDGTTSHTYTYGDSDWRDLLTAYDGTALTYDASGNPTSYYNGASYTMTWRNGRELSTLTKGGKKTSYEYDVDGLRSLKTNPDGSYSVYYWLGNLLLAEERHTGNSTRVLVFSYDENNSPIGFQFKTDNGPWYYYLYAKNIQGDIVALYRRDTDSSGNKIATHIANYEYDPWGKLLSIKNAAGADMSGYPDSAANINPLRYRGYYYDNESGFYYLQSRYYDPSIGRFISADSYYSTGQDFLGYNMFAYCGNNPVNNVDDSGSSWFSSLVAAVATVAVAAAVAVAVVASAGSVACLAGAVACGYGASAATVAAASTVATAGCYVVAGGVAACGLSDAGEIMTGTNVIRDYAMGGSQAAYDTLKDGLSVATLGITEMANYADAMNVCFVAGTPIQTANGAVPIEEIKPGDYVWSWDEESGTVAKKQVVETYVNETDELAHIFVGQEEIICTPTHPFYSPVKGWTDAAKLRAGDILVLLNGEYVVVEKVQHELLESPVKVYNFQVEDYHTYYVSCLGILVHNKCGYAKDSVAMSTDDALTTAEEYLRPGYKEINSGSGRYVSKDGFRQVRIGNADITGAHAGAPHINFDQVGYGKYKTYHIYLLDK